MRGQTRTARAAKLSHDTANRKGRSEIVSAFLIRGPQFNPHTVFGRLACFTVVAPALSILRVTPPPA
jgi:hypothetical protein